MNTLYQSPWMSDALRMFRTAVRQFIQEEFVPHQARWRQQQRPDAEAWTQAGGRGILLTDVPQEYGGGGGPPPPQAAGVEGPPPPGGPITARNPSTRAP